jgi:hypothetical protein
MFLLTKVVHLNGFLTFTNELIKGNFNESEIQKVDKDEDTLWYIEKEIRKRKRNCNMQ